MAKKVVDADVLLEKLDHMMGRSWVSQTYYSGSGYGGNSIEDAMRNAGNQMSMQISQNVNNAMNMLIIEMRMAIRAASFDETAGLCGLCRPMEGECLPTDYRPIR